MANFCLIPEDANKFLDAVRSGQVDPEKLANMTSDERHSFFGGLVGESSAKDVNSLFESKLLLKNQQVGFASWAKKVSGITPEVRRDLFAKIERLDRVLNPQEEKAFLKDLASTKLGFDIKVDEAKKIAQLSKQVQDTREAMANGGNRLSYGRAKVELANYINGLKDEAGKVRVRDIPSTMKNSPVESALEGVSKLGGISKSVKASLDNSALFNQGWKTLFTNPVIWQRNAFRSFADIYNTVGGKKVMDEINAEIISRPNYARMVKAKLAIGNVEEAYPSHLPEKLPIAGRLYKASQNAFEGFQFRQRADIFDKYLEIAKKTGANIDDKEQLESIGKLVNSLTGRGYLGAGEKLASGVNNIFFSPRFFKSQLDVLTAHQLQKGVTPFVRKQAAKNLFNILFGTASVMAIAHFVDPKSVELDPRSSNFGKIKAGDTTFNVSGGMASIATLAARIVKHSSKSSTTGDITQLNTGKFGSKTTGGVIGDFLSGKLSPAASVINDVFLKHKDFQGNKPTLKGEAGNLLIPLPISNYNELRKDPNSANDLLAVIADGLGVVTNTYKPKQTDLEKSISELPKNAQDVLKRAEYEPNAPAKKQRGNQLSDAQYIRFSRDSNKEFNKEVTAATNDGYLTGNSWDKDTLKKKLQYIRTDSNKKVLDNMNIETKKSEPLELKHYN